MDQKIKAPELAGNDTSKAASPSSAEDSTSASPMKSDQGSTSIAPSDRPADDEVFRGKGNMIAQPISSSRERLIVHDTSEIAHLMDSARFDQAQKIARAMAFSTLMPAHLNKNLTPEQAIANCFRVVNQALRWGMDPFAVADETYFVQGRVGYQGKLVAAIIQTRAGLVGRLRAEYSGTGDARKIILSGRLQGEQTDRVVDVTVGQAKTGNTMWKSDPDQKLYYSAAIKWARRHTPEIILGVSTDDDLERIQESQPTGPAEVSEAEQEAITLQAHVKEALKLYMGSDKAQIKAECTEFAMTKKVDPDFWRGMLDRLTNPANQS